MYEILLILHSAIRWLVLASLLYAIFRAGRGYLSASVFGKTDNAIRHWTATIAHVQLMIGLILYFKSPVVKYYWSEKWQGITEYSFFALIHMALMLLAVVLITLGSSMAKRKVDDREKYRTMLIWFSIALLIIFIAIPWPFSPLASRQYFR